MPLNLEKQRNLKNAVLPILKTIIIMLRRDETCKFKFTKEIIMMLICVSLCVLQVVVDSCPMLQGVSVVTL